MALDSCEADQVARGAVIGYAADVINHWLFYRIVLPRRCQRLLRHMRQAHLDHQQRMEQLLTQWKHYVAMHQVAYAIQKRWKQKAQQKRMRAAQTIARAVKDWFNNARHVQRISIIEMRRQAAAQVIQTRFRVHRAQAQALQCRQQHSVVMIQTAWRSFWLRQCISKRIQHRRLVKQRAQEIVASTLVGWILMRRRQEKQRVEVMNHSVVMIQQTWRAYCRRKRRRRINLQRQHRQVQLKLQIAQSRIQQTMWCWYVKRQHQRRRQQAEALIHRVLRAYCTKHRVATQVPETCRVVPPIQVCRSASGLVPIRPPHRKPQTIPVPVDAEDDERVHLSPLKTRKTSVLHSHRHSLPDVVIKTAKRKPIISKRPQADVVSTTTRSLGLVQATAKRAHELLTVQTNNQEPESRKHLVKSTRPGLTKII